VYLVTAVLRTPLIVGKAVAKPARLATGTAPFLPQSQECDRAPAHSPEALGYVAPLMRSLLAPLHGRDGLVHCLVDAEDLRQPGDPEDLQYPLLRADQIQRAVVRPHPR
jgi:hypothetical protein